MQYADLAMYAAKAQHTGVLEYSEVLARYDADDLALIEAKAAFSVERTLEIEKTTNHDVVAFLTNVNENIGPASRWVHYGMTSSDVLDTGLALAMVQSGTLLVAAQAELTGAEGPGA